MHTINFKAKTKLIEQLLKQENISLVKKSSLIDKILLKKKQYASIYFHTGNFDKEAVENIKNAKKVIVNSKRLKKEILSKFNLDENRVDVIYPFVDIEYKKPKELKKEFCQKFEIDPKKKIIFFTGRNLKASGVIEFITTIMQLSTENFISIIAGDKKQITSLKFQLTKFKLEDKLLLLEDYENKEELFLVSDIFFLPTHNKSFASNVLKAMFCKNVVFTTANNDSKELIDVFSTMESPSDRSMQFKLEAILQNKDDMKLIKKENRKKAKEFTLEKQLEKVNALLETI